MQSKNRIIYEKTKIIPIPKNLSINSKESINNTDCSLKMNFFSPDKSSPPNNFMIKLHTRINNMSKNLHN